MLPRNSRVSVTTLEPPRHSLSLSLYPGQNEEKRRKGFGLVAFVDLRFEKYNTFGPNKRTIGGRRKGLSKSIGEAMVVLPRIPSWNLGRRSRRYKSRVSFLRFGAVCGTAEGY